MTTSGLPETHPKLKGCLFLFGVTAAFFTIVPFIAGGGLDEFFFPYKEEQFKMVLAGARVTDITENRRYFTYYLDDNETEGYNFGSYVRATAADRKRFTSDYGWESSSLNNYLRRNDRLTKAANSPLLTVHRGSIITRWMLYSKTPEGKIPRKKRPFITQGAYKTAP